MLARFECPRCQTVFTREKGDDDAFVECPSCGALAMSAGDATGVDSDALQRALSSTHDAPTHLQAPPLGSTEAPELSASGPPGSDDDGPHEPSGAVSRPDPFSPSGGAGIFAGLMDQPAEPSGPVSAPPVDDEPVVRATPATRDGIDLGLDDDFKDFALPSTSPGSPALSPQKKKPEPKKQAKGEPPPPVPPRPKPRATAADLSSDGEAVGDALSEEAFGALEAAFDVMAARPTGPGAGANKARGKDGLSEDERAFLRGEQEREPSSSSSSSSSSSDAAAARRPPPKPGQRQAPPRPPPKRATQKAPKVDRARGLSLSDEAKEAAFLPLRPIAASSSGAPPMRARGQLPREMDDGTVELSTGDSSGGVTSRAAPSSDGAERTVPQQRTPPRRAGVSASNNEPTDIVDKSDRKAASAERSRETPSVMRGLPALALVAAVFVGLAGGGAVGALTAPPVVKRNDARARAELQLAEGNRFYEQGRFDDALGKYKAAISIDRAFAVAHRAKGAALAKQQRWDEAAEAYKEYLGLESSAIDASDVKEALGRRGVRVDAPASSAARGGGG